jgi:hypothetical protein
VRSFGRGSGVKRAASRLAQVAAVSLAALVVTAPASSAKTPWTVNGTVFNNTGSTVDNCGLAGGGVGCLFAPYWSGVGDVDDVTIPTSSIAAGSTGKFGFTSPSLVSGGDMYIDYTMPTGTKYEITVEDDDHVSSGLGTGNYVACSQSSPQNDTSAVCSAQWDGTYEAMTPQITFGPSSQASIASVGQRCTATLGGSNPGMLNCVGAGQFGGTPPNQMTMYTFRSLTPGYLQIEQESEDVSCRVGGPGTGVGMECTMIADGRNPARSLQIQALDTDTAQSYSVEIMATATGYDVPEGLVPDPNHQQSTSAAPALRALAVNPGAVRPATSGAAVVAKRKAKNRGALVRYRATQPGTTVFTLARATKGGWRTLPGRTANADLIGSGVKQGKRCVLAPGGRPTGAPCRYRSALRGHFLDRNVAGGNTLQISGRLAGKRLPAGRYRLTAQARHHRAGKLSKPVTARFTVAG